MGKRVADMTPEQRERKCAKERARKAKLRALAALAPEQRLLELERQRVEALDRKLARAARERERQRERQRERKARETPEARDLRKRLDRERAALWRAQQTPEERERFNQAVRDRAAQWAKDNPERAKAAHKAHYEANKEKICAQNKAWREANRERYRARARAWREANKDQIRAAKRERYKKDTQRRAKTAAGGALRRNGVKPDEIRAWSGGRCVICARLPEPGGRDHHFDHDHMTGKVRGLLCSLCNGMLGFARDSQAILAAGIRYLQCSGEDRRLGGVPHDPTSGGLIDGTEGLNYVSQTPRRKRKVKP